MDVLKPRLVWVENRCYRFGDSEAWQGARDLSAYVEDDRDMYQDEADDCESAIEIVPYGGSKFKHTFRVPKAFFAPIAGAKHATRKRIEADTKTNIKLPGIGQDGDIEITGYDPTGIKKARSRIDILVETYRKKLRATHFLSVPLNDGRLIMEFNQFKENVLTNAKGRAVEEALFQTRTKLHLTLGVLLLLDDDERKRAVEALDYCKEHIIRPILEQRENLTVRLQGLEIMNDEPAEARVVYAVVANADQGLQEIAERTMEYFDSQGLTTKWDGRVKLHSTFMNMTFKDREENRSWSKETFDATKILELYRDTLFGEVPLKQIHISQFGTISSDGYYQATSKIFLYDD